MYALLVAAGIIALALLILSAGPRGFVDPLTGLLVKASAIMSRLRPTPREPAARRKKNDEDYALASRRPRGSLAIEDKVIDGPGAAIRLRVYSKTDKSPEAALLFLHGGGWVVGGIESSDSVARLLCLASGALVISVDYRLAPEAPFPAAVEDAVAAYEWALVEAAARGIQGSRVFVSGDSAGGNLAAVLCLEAKRLGLDPPAGQILYYPVTDLSRLDTSSYRLYDKGYLLGRGDMEWFISLYTPDPALRSDPRASPLLATELSGLPPALVLAAEFDVLRDEGEAYAARLAAAGVDTELVRMRGTVHGFMAMSRFHPAPGRAAKRTAAFMVARSS